MRRRYLPATLAVIAVFAAAYAVYFLAAQPEPSAPQDSSSEQSNLDPPTRQPASGGLEEAPCRVRGRVARADDGTPVAGAVVVLRRPNPFGPETSDPLVLRSDTRGEWSADDVAPGLYSLTASAPELVPTAETDIRLSPGKDHSDFSLKLHTGPQTLSGKVTDRRGKPISGVRIDAVPGTDAATASPRIYSTLTDAAGTYAFALPPAHYTFTFAHPDFVPTMGPVSVGPVLRSRDEQLLPGGTITGRVIARDTGDPVAAAEVRVRSPAAAFGSTVGLLTRARADANGVFVLRGVSAGTAAVEAFGRGFGTTQSTDVALGVGEAVDDVEVFVDPGRTISGFVVYDDAETEGVPDMTLNLTNLADLSANRISNPTGPDGRFEVVGLMPGQYMAVVMGANAVVHNGPSLLVGDADTTDALYRVARGSMIRGRTEPPNRALVHAAMAIADLRSSDPKKVVANTRTLMSTFRRSRSKRDGTFEYGPVAPGPYSLSASTPAGRRATKRVIVEDDDIEDVVLPLADGVELSGRVLDQDGRPVSGIAVSFHDRPDEPALDLSTYLGAVAAVAVTKQDGTFTLAEVTPGTYVYSVRTDKLTRVPWADPADANVPFKPRELEVRRPVRDLELRIVSSRSLRGRALDPNGKPLAGAWVSAWPDVSAASVSSLVDSGPITSLGEMQNMQTREGSDPDNSTLAMRRTLRAFAGTAVLADDDGVFEIPNLRYARYSVSAEAAKGAWRVQVESVDPGSPLSLRLERLATLQGSIAGGLAPGGTYSVELNGPDLKRTLRRADDESFELTRLSPGTYQLRIESVGGTCVREIELPEGEVVQLDAPLHAWGRITGRLVDAQTGAPIGGLTHEIVRDSATTMGELLRTGQSKMQALFGASPRTVDAEGYFEVSRLPPGQARISFLAPGTLQTHADVVVTLKEGESRDVGDVAGLAPEAVEESEAGIFGISFDVLHRDGRSFAEVERLRNNFPAAKAGVKLGDRLVAVDDLTAERVGPNALRLLLRRRYIKFGQKRRLVFERDGTRYDVTLRAVRPPDG